MLSLLLCVICVSLVVFLMCVAPCFVLCMHGRSPGAGGSPQATLLQIDAELLVRHGVGRSCALACVAAYVLLPRKQRDRLSSPCLVMLLQCALPRLRSFIDDWCACMLVCSRQAVLLVCWVVWYLGVGPLTVVRAKFALRVLEGSYFAKFVKPHTIFRPHSCTQV